MHRTKRTRPWLTQRIAASVIAAAALSPRHAAAQDPQPGEPRDKSTAAKPKSKDPQHRPPPQKAEKAEKAEKAAPKGEGSTQPEPSAEGEASVDDEGAESPLASGASFRHVMAEREGAWVTDYAEADGAKVGDVLEVRRPFVVEHPITGAPIVDTLTIGRLRVTHVGTELSLAVPIEGGAPPHAGDVVALAVARDAAGEGSKQEGGGYGSDVDAALVQALWARLGGASLEKRVLAFEAFVQRFPSSPRAIALWEEAQALRELIKSRAAPELPPAPPRPPGAKAMVDTTLSSAGEDELDLLVLERERTPADLPPKAPPSPSEAPPPDEEPGKHRHDGGFVRFGFGPSWFNGSYDGQFRQNIHAPNLPASVDLTGVGLTAELLAGGAPVPGFIIAARLALTLSLDPTMQFSELGDGSTDAALDAIAMPFTGVAIDVYPDPTLGIHFFGTVGLTMTELAGDDRVGNPSFIGVGYGGGVGFEGWIADEWSLGIQARVDAAHLVAGNEGSSETSTDETLTIVSPGLQMSFTFN